MGTSWGPEAFTSRADNDRGRPGVRVAVLLADAAQAGTDGKASALGMGWTFTSSPTPPMTLVVLIDVDWSETNQDIPFSVDLVDEEVLGALLEDRVREHQNRITAAVRRATLRRIPVIPSWPTS